ILPLSWRRFADSKSNSSTRFPRKTTTRVSSGWVASMSILLAIDNSSCGAPARGTLARAKPRRAAPRGARRNDGRGGLYDRGPNRAAQRASDPTRAALYLRVGGADDGSRAVGPWPLTCDGRQRCRRDSLHADGHWHSIVPCAHRKQAGRAPSGRPSRGIGRPGLPPAHCARRGTKAARVPLSQYVLFASEAWRGGCPNAANPDTEPSARPSYGPEPTLARRGSKAPIPTAHAATWRPRSSRENLLNGD